ncbi:MAG TPA: MFS transporter [Candidatus Dormibacteraeota bacterium]|nr:MFS transporter [Candidatus Dormibacteraeota bacterium]
MAAAFDRDHPSHRWVVLSNTTLGVMMATINSSIVIISLPAIFRGIHLDTLAPGNVGYLLWMLMAYLLVTAVLVVSLGRLGDLRGRVRIYNAGFAVFTVGSVALALDPLGGGAGALWLIAWRVVQGVGGAMLMANSTAIVTDAFPATQRGLALGINQVAALAGSFIGLIGGGLLSEWSWRAVFFVSVPIGVLGTVWAYHSLHDLGRRVAGRIDWLGNVTFAVGLTALLGAITYGIQPYGGSAEGWGNPLVIAGLAGGAALLAVFCLVELRTPEPMFDLRLFRIRAVAAGNAAMLLASIARGGLQFMLIIWLQGIWLPLHGYDYVDTPLWAGIYLLPLTLGFLLAGPLSGHLSDRFGARAFASGGLLLSAVTFAGLLLLPVNFDYRVFAVLLALNGMASGLFAAPNTTSVMNAVPANRRGSAAGMVATFQNAGMTLSIGVFFSLMIAGLAGSLPAAMHGGLVAQHVPDATATRLAGLPPVGSLFAAFLGFNPLASLLGPHVLAGLPPASAATLTGHEFFPHLMSTPFHDGLVIVFGLAIAMSLVGAGASAMRGRRVVHTGTVERNQEAAA